MVTDNLTGHGAKISPVDKLTLLRAPRWGPSHSLQSWRSWLHFMRICARLMRTAHHGMSRRSIDPGIVARSGGSMGWMLEEAQEGSQYNFAKHGCRAAIRNAVDVVGIKSPRWKLLVIRASYVLRKCWIRKCICHICHHKVEKESYRTFSICTNYRISSVNVASTFPGLYLVEKMGRRNLLLMGAIGEHCLYDATEDMI